MSRFLTDPDCMRQMQFVNAPSWIDAGAAGNGNGQPTEQRFNGACIMVTSCMLKNGRPAFANKACGDNIDFAIFSGYQSGTSHSAPFLLALAGYLRSKWPGITQDQVYQYFKDHCVDLGDKNKFGWGAGNGRSKDSY